MRRSIGRLIEGVTEGDPISIAILGVVIIALLAWGINSGRRRRREREAEEREYQRSE